MPLTLCPTQRLSSSCVTRLTTFRAAVLRPFFLCVRACVRLRLNLRVACARVCEKDFVTQVVSDVAAQ